MNTGGLTDTIVVINGPEDGTEFPLVRAPFRIGQDIACEIPLRLDNGVRPIHALVTAVSDGYRVRQLDSAPVYVNGKRAGMFRSRIVRSGGTLQVGHTLMAVECVPDGLAVRSHGIVSESDLGWLLERGGHVAVQSAVHAFRLFLGLFGKLHFGSLLVMALLFTMYYLFPSFHYWVNWSAWYLITLVQGRLG